MRRRRKRGGGVEEEENEHLGKGEQYPETLHVLGGNPVAVQQ